MRYARISTHKIRLENLIYYILKILFFVFIMYDQRESFFLMQINFFNQYTI